MAHLTFIQFLQVIIVFISIINVTKAGMDITAYEYQRSFHKNLTLGECPHRQVSVNGSDVQVQRCSRHQKGVIRSLPRALSNTRNELIKSANGVVVYLGLCGAEAASYLGILHQGECVAVEIASRLTFGERIVVRAFIGYYRTALDILDTTEEDIRPGMETYYSNKYYVKNRSYGTLETIFAQFRFFNNSQAAMAKEVSLSDPKMSTYMKEISRIAGEPKSVRIISLSTASGEDFKVETWKEWNRALRYVQILEMKINETRDKIKNNEIQPPPHLMYELFPFIRDDVSFIGRSTNPIVWEKTSMMEVQLRKSILIVKKMNKKCRRNKTKVCRRVRELRRNLKVQQTEVRKVRAAWMNLTAQEKDTFVKKNSSEVTTLASVTKRLYKDWKKMIKKIKFQRLMTKQNKTSKLNQIPPSIRNSKRQGRQHRIRHQRRKLSKRKKGKKIKLSYWKRGLF